MSRKRAAPARAGLLRLPILVTLAILGPAQARPGAPYPSQAHWEERVPRAAVDGAVEDLLGLAERRELAIVLDRVAAHRAAAARRPEFHEAVLLALGRALAERPPEPALTPVLERLAAHRAVALAPHPEGSQHGIPAFPVAAAARGARTRWRLESVRGEATAALAGGDLAWFEARVERFWRPSEVAALRMTLVAATPAAVEAALPALVTLWARRPELARTATSAARVLASAAPLEVALAGPGGAHLLPDLARLDRFVSATEAREAWKRIAAGGTPEARSVALVELARRGIDAPALAALGDPEAGPAAALALARSGRVVALRKTVLDPHAPTGARRHAALGLRLEGSPEARAALEEAAAAARVDAGVDDGLRDALSRWRR